MTLTERLGFNKIKLRSEPPADLTFYLTGLLSRMENQHMSLEEAATSARAEIEKSKNYDLAYQTAREHLERVIQFLKDNIISNT